jgi:hypothetical protein
MFQNQFAIGIDQVPVQIKTGANELHRHCTLNMLSNWEYTAVLMEHTCKFQSPNYQTTLPSFSEGRTSHLYIGGRTKSRI